MSQMLENIINLERVNTKNKKEVVYSLSLIMNYIQEIPSLA